MDSDLLRRLQARSADALEQAIAQYGAYVLTVIRNRSRGALTAEDHEEIASDVFLSLWYGAKDITSGQLRPWMGAVARNKTVEAMRRKKVFVPLEDETLVVLDKLWEHMYESQRCDAVRQALSCLSEEDREIFYRFYDLAQTTAQLAETGVSAQTDDFVFTLESMLVSDDSLYAMMRIEAKTADAAEELAALPDASGEEKERGGMLFVSVSNNSGEGRQREWKNGGMGMDLVEVDGNTAYALLRNTGGEFETGDTVLFGMSCHGKHVNLFEIPVPEQLQTELVIELDASVYEGKDYGWDTATITPISFRLDGHRSASMGQNETSVSLTLTDGTSFAFPGAADGYAQSPYGTYGALSYSGTGSADTDAMKSSWLFSKLLDLQMLASITVDGRTYEVQK